MAPSGPGNIGERQKVSIGSPDPDYRPPLFHQLVLQLVLFNVSHIFHLFDCSKVFALDQVDTEGENNPSNMSYIAHPATPAVPALQLKTRYHKCWSTEHLARHTFGSIRDSYKQQLQICHLHKVLPLWHSCSVLKKLLVPSRAFNGGLLEHCSSSSAADVQRSQENKNNSIMRSWRLH